MLKLVAASFRGDGYLPDAEVSNGRGRRSAYVRGRIANYACNNAAWASLERSRARTAPPGRKNTMKGTERRAADGGATAKVSTMAEADVTLQSAAEITSEETV
jgi:hypothetical protein